MSIDPTEREHDIGQWLESALTQYGKAEPRTGLESRLLANLRAERNRIASRRRWWWAMAAATALAVIVAAVWVGEGERERNRTNTVGASTTQREEVHALVQQGPPPQIAYPARGMAQHWPVHWPIHDLAEKRTPKLDQFPSRRNMSDGELLLVRRLNERSTKEALLESLPSREEVDLSIGSLEIRPLQIPDIEISESETN
jgi:hypothetical protein